MSVQALQYIDKLNKLQKEEELTLQDIENLSIGMSLHAIGSYRVLVGQYFDKIKIFVGCALVSLRE